MNQNQPPEEKRVPLGEPMPLDELMAMADMDDAAIEDAQQWFEDTATPTGKRLVNARRERR